MKLRVYIMDVTAKSRERVKVSKVRGQILNLEFFWKVSRIQA